MDHMRPVFKMLSKEAKKEPLFIVSATGRKLRVNLLRKDGDCVEFYDVTKNEQFVSSYYVKTLLERDRSYGLTLDGGIPDWSVDAKEMAKVYSWLEEK